MPRNNQIRVRDLQDQLGMPWPRPMLICLSCGGEYSANAGDYWSVAPSTVIRCCGRPCRLVQKRVVLHGLHGLQEAS